MQVYVSIEQFIRGNAAVGFMFLGYSVANAAYVYLVK